MKHDDDGSFHNVWRRKFFFAISAVKRIHWLTYDAFGDKYLKEFRRWTLDCRSAAVRDNASVDYTE